MSFSNAALAAGALALLAATAAGAQSKTPNIRDEKAVNTWMAENRIDQNMGGQTRAWLLIGVAPEGVYLSRRQLETAMRKNVSIVVNRLELFEPIVDGTRSISSISFEYEINCRDKTHRRTMLTTFVRHNLAGSPVVENIDEPFTPVAADPMMKSVADDICRAADTPIPGLSRGQAAGGLGTMTVRRGR